MPSESGKEATKPRGIGGTAALAWLKHEGASSLLRRAALTLSLGVALVLLWRSITPHYPIAQWLAPRYFGYWALALGWSAACVAAGHATVYAVLGRTFAPLAQLSIAFAIGVFEFQLLIFLLGLAQAYGTATFIALPAAMLLAGAPSLRRYFKRLHAAGWTNIAFGRGPTTLGWLVLAFGFLALVAIYLPTMTPDNVAFDARWRHMMLAEQYRVQGGLRRFPEGWVFGASPQFSPLLYAWAFLLPVGSLFDRMELCAHLEDVSFLIVTLVGIPAMTRRLVPSANPGVAWVARFLFPGVLLYDSSLAGGTDHLGTIFAAPLFFLTLEFWKRPSARVAALLGACIAGALCAKETTGMLLAPVPIALVTARLGFDLVLGIRQRRMPRSLGPALCAGAATLALTAPHWLKNWLWYGDPLFPVLHEWLRLRPWIPNGNYIFQWPFMETGVWRPPAGLRGWIDTARALYEFSFKPHDWFSMHGALPIFGSLFTLLLLALPFLKRTTRIWFLVLWVHVGIAIWFRVHHEDRYLQVLLPFMAAVVAAIATLIWRSRGIVLRSLLALLVLLQAVWGADVWFFPTHSMVDTAPIKVVADLLGQGYLHRYAERFVVHGLVAQQNIGASVPVGATLLIHERQELLGYNRRVVTDLFSNQYGIDYTALGARDRIDRKLRDLGVTHLVWPEQRGVTVAPLAWDLFFLDFAERVAGPRRSLFGFRIAPMPAHPPPASSEPPLAVFIGCDTGYKTGLYAFKDLDVPLYGPARAHYPVPREPVTRHTIERADAAVVDRACATPPHEVQHNFERVTTRDEGRGPQFEIWLRRQAR